MSSLRWGLSLTKPVHRGFIGSILMGLCALGCSTQAPANGGDAAHGDAAQGGNAAQGDAAQGDAAQGDAAQGDAGSVPDGQLNDGGGVLVHEPGAPGTAFVHLFEWKWTDIARECETFLGPNGYAAVQVSPPSEHAVLPGFPWWQRYQVVSYALESRSGTAAEFKDMVTRCARAGVAIYVDAVINHTTGQAKGVGSNGTEFTKYEYGDLYTQEDFHFPPCIIQGSDYQNDKSRVQTCELLQLSDLDTSSAAVQNAIANYLIELVEIGVRGFRIDAAKHMSPEDLDAIINRVSEGVGSEKAPYFFMEVIDYGGEAVRASDYLTVGSKHNVRVDVTEFKYTGIGSKFLNRDGQLVSELAGLSESAWGLLPSDRAVVFTNNHDTQRNDSIFYQDGALHDLANVFLLAFPYGYPKIMSSFAFERPAERDIGPPSADPGATDSIYAGGATTPNCAASNTAAKTGQWVCEHRARSVVGMLGFRRATAGAPVSRLWDNGGNQIAFGRSGKGFIVINREQTPLERAFETDLPAGSYCDVVSGALSQGACTGPVVEVSEDGTATFTVNPLGAVAIHVEARR